MESPDDELDEGDQNYKDWDIPSIMVELQQTEQNFIWGKEFEYLGSLVSAMDLVC